MNAHLIEISKTVAEGARAILVLDSAGWLGAKALRISENITRLILPPHAPELNPIKNVRAELRANRLAISVCKSAAQIVNRCCDPWNVFANDINTARSISNRDYAKAVRDQGRWYQASVSGRLSPRNTASVGIAALPARCASATSTAPAPQATVNPPSTVPGAPCPGANRARNSFTLSPATSHQALGVGDNPLIWRRTSTAGRAQSTRASALSILAA